MTVIAFPIRNIVGPPRRQDESTPVDPSIDPVMALLAERRREFRAWMAADKRAVEAHKNNKPDYATLARESDDLQDRVFELEEAIANTPATTIAGVMGKLAIVPKEFGTTINVCDSGETPWDERLVSSAHQDLRVIAKNRKRPRQNL